MLVPTVQWWSAPVSVGGLIINKYSRVWMKEVWGLYLRVGGGHFYGVGGLGLGFAFVEDEW